MCTLYVLYMVCSGGCVVCVRCVCVLEQCLHQVRSGVHATKLQAHSNTGEAYQLGHVMLYQVMYQFITLPCGVIIYYVTQLLLETIGNPNPSMHAHPVHNMQSTGRRLETGGLPVVMPSNCSVQVAVT